MAVVYGTGHMKTPLGLCKILEIVTCMIGIILVATRHWKNDLLDAYFAGTIIGLIVSALILLFSATALGASANKAMSMQFAFHFLICVYLIIVSSILLSKYWGDVLTAAGALGIIAACVYMIDGIVSYKSYGIAILCS